MAAVDRADAPAAVRDPVALVVQLARRRVEVGARYVMLLLIALV